MSKYDLKNNSRALWICGIIGCLLFGTGDWLLGFTDPGIVSEKFSVIKAGNGADYDLARIVWTLTLGTAGMFFLIPGFRAQADILRDEKRKPLFRFLMTLCTVSWIVIHTTVSAGIYVYSWCMHRGDSELAQALTLDVMALFQPMQIIAYIFLAVPLIVQIADIVRGKTVCGKTAVLFSPLVWMAVFAGTAKILPPSPFANGLDTFCMNGGMTVWLLYLCICASGKIGKQGEEL